MKQRNDAICLSVFASAILCAMDMCVRLHGCMCGLVTINTL